MAIFICIDGLDGCGKATQVQAVASTLRAAGKRVVTLDFPNYDSDSSAALRMYLNGELGKDPSSVNPYMASSFFAVDRFISFKQKYSKYFEEDDNTIILSDRYISSNIIYQGEKIKDAKQRRKFIEWCYQFECDLCGLPKERATILLTLPPEVSQQLLSERYNGDEKKKDIHESNLGYLKDCYSNILDTIQFVNSSGLGLSWIHIDCCNPQSNRPYSVQQITAMILKTINDMI